MVLAFLTVCGVHNQATAQTAAQPTPQELAKQLANPVASLVSVPFQNNWDFNVGPAEDTRYLLNFQPVMPFSLNEKWNLIGRVIVPIMSQPPLATGADAEFGLGDFVVSGFFSPKKTEPFIWGVGPVFLLPISANPSLGTEKWGVGPTFVVLKQSGKVTFGGLANHIWSFEGDETRADVNQTFLQPFFSYTPPSGITLSLSSEMTANWEAPSGDEWTVPLTFQVSKVTKLGKRPVNLGIGAGPYLEAPGDQPSWRLRLLMVLIYPTG
jgi:hypothetical protein